MTSGRYTPNLGNNSSYSNGKMQQELDKIKLALDNVLSRYADQPNQMESDLDMNSNQILNLLDAVDLSEPATYRQLLAGLGGTTPVYNSEEVVVQGQLEYQLPITDSSDAKDYWVYVGGIRQAPDTDYTIDLPNGKLVFVEQPPAGETILSFGFRPNVKFVDGNIQIPVVREKVDVTVNGQLDYTFNLDLTRSTIHITGSGVDDGQKFEGVHYKLTSANSLQFFESYPIGSKIVIGVPTNEGASSLGALIFGDIELAKGANVQDGTLIRVPSRGNAEYIVEPSSYAPLVGDHTMDTGQVLRYNHNGIWRTSQEPYIVDRADVKAIWVDADVSVTTGTVFTTNTIVVGLGGAILPNLGTAGGRVLQFSAGGGLVRAKIDASGATGVATENTYQVFVDGDNFTSIEAEITNGTLSDGNEGATNLKVSHAFYVNGANNVRILDGIIHTHSGAGVFVRDCDGLVVRGNKLTDCLWYPINLESGVSNYFVEGNIIHTADTRGSYWGGLINDVSQIGEVQNKNGVIRGNTLSGYCSYGAVIRLQSPDGLLCEDNEVSGAKAGSLLSGTSLTPIRLVTRGTSSSNKQNPWKDVTIRNNRILDGSDGSATPAIYCSNDWHTNNPAKNLKIYGNVIRDNGVDRFLTCVGINGLSGGIDGVEILNNEVMSYADATQVINGAIGINGVDANGAVRNVKLGGNVITSRLTPTDSKQVGIVLEGHVDDVIQVSKNFIDNQWFGVRTINHTGSAYEIDDNIYTNIGSVNTLLSNPLVDYGTVITATAVFDAPNLTTGTQTFTDITVTGAALGDLAQASFNIDVSALTITAYVRAANSVRVVLLNQSGGDVDLASATLTVQVTKQS